MRAAPALVFDVSSIVVADRDRPTGIHRVVFETALELITLTDGAVEFTQFDRVTGRYRRVEHQVLLDRVEVLNAVAPSVPAGGRSAPATTGGRTARFVRRSVEVFGRRSPATARSMKVALAHARRSALAFVSAARSTGADRRRRRDLRTIGCHSDSWTSATTYCSLGVDFAHNDLDHLARCRTATGATVALMVHDIIPIVDPQFATRDLDDYYEALVGLADVIIVTSDHAAADLRRYFAQLGGRAPRLAKVILSSSVASAPPVRPSSLPEAVEREGYVMYVSTITLRKNHHVLFDVWSSLISDAAATATDAPSGVPYLLVVGSPGALSDETMSRLRRDPVLRRRVLHLEGLSDSEIAWLYAHCAFTVYPSLSEGWGLPVSESLDLGKVCLASDRTSLPEAGEGLALHLDPFDRAAWRSTITALWTDAAYRARLEADIAARHRRVTPTMTATQVLAALERQ